MLSNGIFNHTCFLTTKVGWRIVQVLGARCFILRGCSGSGGTYCFVHYDSQTLLLISLEPVVIFSAYSRNLCRNFSVPSEFCRPWTRDMAVGRFTKLSRANPNLICKRCR